MAIACGRRSGECWEWARVYMKYCICSVRDELSFGLGMLSVLSWGVAEIPQIIANYREKSVEGLSLGFLITWIVGDLFNLVGCHLEPATLPTQYYMAVLYTMTTAVLASQIVYYVHIYPRLKCSRLCHKGSREYQPEAVERVGKGVNKLGMKIRNAKGTSSPIPLPMSSGKFSPGRELYYTSARSLSRSHTPTAGSYLAQRMTPPVQSGNLTEVEEPLLGGHVSRQSTPVSRTKPLLCLVSALIFIGTFNFQPSVLDKLNTEQEILNQGFVIHIGRKLLQVNSLSLGEGGNGGGGNGGSGIGTFLGWAMAAIYMGGRLPQIILNMRRGNVEGLSPFMFMFALVGNATYVASILIESMDWSKIKSNLPWLVDAGGCVMLDTFIIIQFIYFYYRAPQDVEVKHENLNAA